MSVPMVISPLVVIVQKESIVVKIIIKSFREIRSKFNKPEKPEIRLRQLSKPKLVSVQFRKHQRADRLHKATKETCFLRLLSVEII